MLKRLVPLIAVLSLLLTGCSLEEASPLNPKGPVGEEQFMLIKLSLGIMFLVMAVVFIIFFYVIIRYRKRRGDTSIPKQVEGNHKLEIIWTVIPIVLLFILAIPTVGSTFSLAKDYSEYQDAIQVKVTAHQFWWEFEYPELGIRTAQELYMPTDKIVQFQLTSSDVIHSFWIPGLGGKIDTNPGMINKMFLQADEAGIYKGKCAELCGASHALMDFKAIAVSPEEFDAWVADMKEPAVVTEDVQAGKAIFDAQCLQCHAIDVNAPGFGPNLNGFAERMLVAGYKENNTEELKKWILNPDDIKAGHGKGKGMPAYEGYLTDQELDDLVLYLQSLK